MKPFKNKIALVTGSTDGIGETIADELHNNDAIVIITSRNQDAIDTKIKELNIKSNRAFGIKCDVSNPESVCNLVKVILDKFGRLDLAVNSIDGGYLAR